MLFLGHIAKRLLGVKALRRPLSVLLLAALDGAALLLGLGVALYLPGQGASGGARLAGLAPLLVVAWVTLFAAFRLYDRAPVRRNPGALVGGAFTWAGLVIIGAVLYPRGAPGLLPVLVCALLGLLFAGAFRFAYEGGIEKIYRRGLGQTPVLLVGGEADRARVRGTVGAAGDAGRGGALSVVGEVDLGGRGAEADLAALRGALDRTGADGVVLAGAERLPDEELLELLKSVRLRGAFFRVVPGALALARGRAILSEGMGLPLLEVRYPGLDNTQRALKRALDATVSAAGLVLLSPVLLAVAAAIRLDSPGPVLFRQKRVGADEKVFVLYKFRSMREGAEGRQGELEGLNEAGGAAFKMRRDPRVTRVGRFIRRWSLDELPQLFNVLKGEMSLVGPRPLPVRDFLRMEEAHKRRLEAAPGMTGYWQISGRSRLPFEEMVKLDLYYLENWSLSFDLKIILKTIGAVLKGEGAY